jgi:predicted  nucleic acid-binding Zn-ribbon protein
MSEPTLTDVLSAITTMQGSMTTMQGSIAQLRGEFREELTRLRVDVMARIDRLQDDLTHFRDDNFVTYARVERLGETTQASVQGFEKEISGIHRQIRNLQDEVRQLRGER